METKPFLSLGRAKKGTENVLAVRLYSGGSYWRNKLTWLRKLTCGELDVKFISKIYANPPIPTDMDGWNRNRVRPLKIGSSISHGDVTAGTLGCFVTVKETGNRVHILSNNHVIACQNNATIGDQICQPGTADGGSIENDTVAKLQKFIHIKDRGNTVDAAVAGTIKQNGFRLVLNYDSEDVCDTTTLSGLGRLNGLFDEEIEPGIMVAKVGRTTGTTVGKITAVEVDNLPIMYSHGRIYFNSQIEIEGAEDGPFSRGGDSGSMIVSAPDGRAGKHLALGLLFAGGPIGGSNGMGITYANYMNNVLEALDAKLIY